MGTPSPFDLDPAALEWARTRVLAVTARWRAYAEHADETGMLGNAEKWRRIAVLAENDLIGGKTDHIGAFDHRRPFVPPDPTLKEEANGESTE